MAANFINPNPGNITIAQIVDAGSLGRAILAMTDTSTRGPIVSDGGSSGTVQVIAGFDVGQAVSMTTDHGVVIGT